MADVMTRGTQNRFAKRREMERRQARYKKRVFIQRNLPKAIVTGVLLFGIFVGVFIGNKVTLYAQSVKINDYGRQRAYATYTVKDGDTIWTIASDLSALNPEFNDIRQYVLAIEKANKNMSGQIKEGEIILIPYYISPDGTVSHDKLYSKYGIKDQ